MVPLKKNNYLNFNLKMHFDSSFSDLSGQASQFQILANILLMLIDLKNYEKKIIQLITMLYLS